MSSKLSALIIVSILSFVVKHSYANQRTVDISVAVGFTGTASSLAWSIFVNPAQVEELGVLREGDTVTFSIPDASEMTFAQSEMVYRWFVSKSCRKRFLRKSKCTETWANGPCLTPMTDHPVNGSLQPKLTFQHDAPSGVEGQKVPDLETILGSGVSVAKIEPQLPVRLTGISGGLTKTLPKCSKPMQGSPISNTPTLHGDPIGTNNIHVPWFTIRVMVIPPDLEP